MIERATHPTGIPELYRRLARIYDLFTASL